MRTSRSLASLFGAVFAIQACGSTAPQPSATGPFPTGTPAASGIEITVLDHQDLRVKSLQAIIPGFEAAMRVQGKNITVKLVDANIANDVEFKQKLIVQYEGDDPPDVTAVGASGVPDYATAGYLLDLTDRLAAWPDYNQHFYPIMRELDKQADGRAYSIARGASVIEYFVRKDVLAANGISTDQPNSWDDLIGLLKALSARTNLPVITLPAGRTWGGSTFDEGFKLVFLGTGGTLFDSATNKWVVSSQALRDTFGFYYTLQSNRLLPTRALLGPHPWEPTKYDGFTGTDKNGSAIPVAPPITTQGSWGWIFDWGPNGARPIPDIQSKVITWAFPSKAANQNYVFAGEDWAWVIAGKSKHPDEAWEFLKYVVSGQGLASDIAAVGALAPRDDVSSLAPYSNFPYLITMEKLLPSGKTFKAPVGLDKIAMAVGDATEQILLNRMNGDQAAAYFAQHATNLLGADAVESQ